MFQNVLKQITLILFCNFLNVDVLGNVQDEERIDDFMSGRFPLMDRSQ